MSTIKDTEKQILSPLFDNRFDIDNFYNFLNEALPSVNLDNLAHTNPIYLKKEYYDFIESAYDCGTYRGDESDPTKFLKIYVVKLKKATSLISARTMQRNLIAHFLDNKLVSTALVAFYDDFSSDWRLSFVKTEKKLVKNKNNKLATKTILSPPKRFSFLVGGSEKNHTCKSRFLDLIKQSTKPTLNEIEEVFNVETVTNEFFKEYKRLFLELTESLEDNKSNDPKIKKEFDDKNIKSSDFAKKLMGQLVFLYFLQKKGWLGVELNEKWGSGPKNFLKNIFDECLNKGDNFFNDVLEPLFYCGLSQEVEDYHYSDFGYKVPFLNGGLFEPMDNYNWRGTDIKLKNSIFKKIFKTFDKFNFTVREDEPLEKEVAVDPEMLGKVFENLLEIVDRKSKGAFYTPRHVVHYICQQNLINYLDVNTDIPINDLKEFIEGGDLALDTIIKSNNEIKKYNKSFTKINLSPTIKENSSLLDELLKEIKVVDPAVGSGAFPVGMMNEIVKARQILLMLNGIFDFNVYDLKKETIEYSLYGVDLDASAIDITKLRFWLSLVVDEEDMDNIRPLPNLDNHIMCGNSLINRFEDIKLFDEELIKSRTGQTTLVLRESEFEFQKLEKKKQEYFNEKSTISKLKLKEEIEDIKWDFINKFLIEEGHSDKIDAINSFRQSSSQPFFIWELEFSEIFKGKNPGFDVVIGNPPYVRVQEIPHSDLDFYSKYYNLATGHIDMSILFIELASKIVKENGFVGFISSNMFLTTDYGIKLRPFLINEFNVIQMIDFGDLDVFSDAMAYVSIFIFSKQAPSDFDYYSVDDLNVSLNNINFNKILLKDLDENAWNLKNYALTKSFNKIKSNPTFKELGITCNYGIVTGSDEVFAFKEKNACFEEEALIPLIRADRCERYVYVKPKEYILYPYKSKDGKSVLLTEKELEIDFPLLKKYFYKNKEILSKRKDSRNTLEDSDEWYKLMRPSNFSKFSKEKIVYQGLTKHNKFTIDLTKSACAGGGVFFIVSDNKDIDIKFILAVLNSSLIEIYLHSITPLKKGGYHQYSTRTINNLNIPLISLDEQEIFVTKVTEILDLNEKILEAKDNFTNWLMTEFNILKLSKKLQNFFDLTFEEFLIEAKKKKININDENIKNKLNSKFIESTKIILPKINQINNLDEEINYLVYDLYGLSEEEKNAVKDIYGK